MQILLLKNKTVNTVYTDTVFQRTLEKSILLKVKLTKKWYNTLFQTQKLTPWRHACQVCNIIYKTLSAQHQINIDCPNNGRKIKCSGKQTPAT